MANLEEITVEIRDGRSDGAGPTEPTPTRQESTKRRRSQKRRNTDDSKGLENELDQEHEEPKEEEAAIENGKTGDSQRQDVHSAPEVVRSRFYEDYHKVAEEYDKEFMKKYDEDLNTTLIFAGLFSAVTSAFIVEVSSQLQPDPNEETAALLRVLIYKVDNTTFGGDVPTVPAGWSGPPRTIVQVQAILYASLAASLLCAFLAMLGKQWLNQYASTGVRGTVIERGRDRQRKIGGIISWHFEYVMESLPLMLQAALLLLGCALYRYLWEIDTTVASVILGVTSFGLVFYFFIVVAGAASKSCPYQTPGSRALHSAALAVASAFRCPVGRSETVDTFRANVAHYRHGRKNLIPFLTGILRELPTALAIDVFHPVRAMTAFASRMYTRLLGAPSTPLHGLDQQSMLDLQSISWILQISLDKAVHLSTLEYLATMVTLADFDPALVTGCFDIFIGCVKVINRTVAITRGLDQLATVSATCLLRTFSHLSTTDPTSNVLTDIRQRYSRVFPPWTNFDGLPFFHTLDAIHRVIHPHLDRWWHGWEDYWPPSYEHAIFAHALTKLAQSEYRKENRLPGGVPPWITRFVVHSLSLDPLPPTSVVVDCLSIVAMDLGCNVSSTRTTAFDKSAIMDGILTLVSQKLETTIPSVSFDPIVLRRDITFHEIGSTWHRSEPLITVLLEKKSPISVKRVAILASPYLPWEGSKFDKSLIQLLAAAASVVPYTDEIGRSMVCTLLRIAFDGSPHIPTFLWSWLNKRPPLPPICPSRSRGSKREVVQAVRALGDVETLKSYLFLVWSEWGRVSCLEEMCTSIREDFGGIEMGHHREDLLRRLDHVLERLDLGSVYLKAYVPHLNEVVVQEMKEQYAKLKEVLLEMGAVDEPIRAARHSMFMCAIPPPCP